MTTLTHVNALDPGALVSQGVRWPVCMNTFMLQSDIVPLLSSIGYEGVSVDTNNSRMDAQAVGEDDIGASRHGAWCRIHRRSVPCHEATPRAHRLFARTSALTEAAAKAAGVCTHAIRAQLRRQKQSHGAAVAAAGAAPAPAAADDDAAARVTVHKGERQFSHLRNYDMSDLCARVVIVASKAGTADSTSASTSGSAGVAQLLQLPRTRLALIGAAVVAAAAVVAVVVRSRRA